MRLNEVTLMRSILALLIVFMHSFTCYNGSWDRPAGYVDIPLYKWLNYPEEVFLMFGKETKGLPEDLLFAHPDTCVRIPMRNHLRSLNLSNSVAIAVYEVLRQYDFEGLQVEGQLTTHMWGEGQL